MILPSSHGKAIFFIRLIVLPTTMLFPYPFYIENVTFHLWSIFFACAQLLKSLWCSMQFQCKCSSHLYRLNCRCSLQLYQTFCTPFSSWIQFCNSVQYFLSLFFRYCTEKDHIVKISFFTAEFINRCSCTQELTFCQKGRQQKCIGKNKEKKK